MTGHYGPTRDTHLLAIIKFMIATCKKKSAESSKWLQALASKRLLGIKLERHLKNEAVEKASVKGDIPKVARTYEGDNQSMAWLHAETDDHNKSLVSTLWQGCSNRSGRSGNCRTKVGELANQRRL